MAGSGGSSNRGGAWWGRGGRGESSLDKEARFRCLGCLHVRAGVIAIAVYHLVAQSALAFGLLGHAFLRAKGSPPAQTVDFEIRAPPAVGTAPEEAEESSHVAQVRFTQEDASLTDEGLAIKMGLVLCAWLLSAWLLWGAVKGRAGALLPFFCFQVMDFCGTALQALTAHSRLSAARHRLLQSPNLPFKAELSRVDPQTLAVLLLVAFVAILALKAYFIRIVWSLYQYLRLRAQMSIILSYTEVEEAGGAVVEPPPPIHPAEISPPDYETATKMPLAPPPSYSPA